MIRKAFLLAASVALMAVCVSAGAQVGWVLSGEVRGGAAWVSPRPDAAGISMDNEGAFTVDYTQRFGRYFGMNLSYLYTNLSVASPAPYWLGPYEVEQRFPMQSLSLTFQVHFGGGKMDPYVGAGLNVLYSGYDPGRVIYVPGGYLTTGGGWGGGYVGPAFQAGISFYPAGPLVINIEARYVDNGLAMDRYVETPVYGGWAYYRAGTYKLKVNPVIVGFSIGARW